MRRRHIPRKLRFVLIPVMAALVLAIVGLLVMGLWNWLVPAIFGWKAVTFWQALGLVILSHVLFGRFHGRPGGSSRWRHRMMERWEQMTPEEREKFLAGMRGRCRPFEPPPERPAAQPTA
jgi:hypothetical protein